MDETPDHNPVADPIDPAARERLTGPPDTMPEEARTGWAEQPDPADAPLEEETRTEVPGGVPEGTAPEVPSALWSSEAMQPVDGVHTPDVGPSGEDFDTDARPLPNRSRTDA
jgi:hypothetical protein